MKTANGHKTLALTAIITALSFSYANLSVAADNEPNKHSWQDSMNLENYDQQRAALEDSLSSAKTVEQLRTGLEKAGYRITSINTESANKVEYEVVKGDHTFEVRSNVDADTLKDVEVTNNLWRAENTKRALKDADYDASDVKFDKDNEGRYSDAQFADTWTQEKEALIKAMPVGKEFADYKKILEDKGYQITSVNDQDDDEIEFEIVKGDHSFEVNLEYEDDSKVVDEVKVTNNIWHSEETEKALGND